MSDVDARERMLRSVEKFQQMYSPRHLLENPSMSLEQGGILVLSLLLMTRLEKIIAQQAEMMDRDPAEEVTSLPTLIEIMQNPTLHLPSVPAPKTSNSGLDLDEIEDVDEEVEIAETPVRKKKSSKKKSRK